MVVKYNLLKGGKQAKIYENRILRRIFMPKRDEKGEWRRGHNEKLHSLWHSPNLVRVIKSRILRWTGHIARLEESSSTIKFLTGNPKANRPLRRPRK